MSASLEKLAATLPPGYRLDQDAELIVLRAPDGSLVTAFNARSFSPEVVRQSVEDHDRRELPKCRGTLCAYFFGHFELFCGSEALPMGRNAKALTILKYLLVNRTRPISQDHLMDLLWPASGPTRARRSLNTAVHGLRKILHSCPLPADCPGHIVLHEGHYHLWPALQVWTDVDEFDAHCDKGDSLKQTGQVSMAVEEYERAVDLYRGDYLAEDLYEEWTMIERQRLANRYIDALCCLSQYFIDTGQHRNGLRACYGILDKGPYHELGHCLLMEYYAKYGLRTQALHQYDLYKRMLKGKFGVEPSAKVRSHYQEILRGGRVRSLSAFQESELSEN